MTNQDTFQPVPTTMRGAIDRCADALIESLLRRKPAPRERSLPRAPEPEKPDAVDAS